MYRFLAEQGRRDSNPQPPVLETGALPIRATPLRIPSARSRGKGGEPAWAKSTGGPTAVYTPAPPPHPEVAMPPTSHHHDRCGRRRQHRGPGDDRPTDPRTTRGDFHPRQHQSDQPAGAGISSWRRAARRRCKRRSWAAERLTGETAFHVPWPRRRRGGCRRQRTPGDMGPTSHGRLPSSISRSRRWARWSLTLAAVSEIPRARATSSDSTRRRP